MNRLTVFLSALLSGLIFGFGLILSGMVNPAIVLAFLDIAGDWNASLLWVMGGAVSISAFAFHIGAKQQRSYLGLSISLPTSRTIDRRLLIGSFLFGAGWGIAGFCPGPALVMAGSGSSKAIIFTLAMLAGMGIFELVRRDTTGPQDVSTY